MHGADSVRKIASLVVIAVVVAVSVWLRPPPALAPAADLLPSRSIRVGPGSYPGTTPVRPRSERGRIRVRPGSEYEYAATQVSGTNEWQELRTPKVGSAPPEDVLVSRALAFEAGAPSVVREAIETPARGPVSRAFAIASHETGIAFRTASRAIRGLF